MVTSSSYLASYDVEEGGSSYNWRKSIMAYQTIDILASMYSCSYIYFT